MQQRVCFDDSGGDELWEHELWDADASDAMQETVVSVAFQSQVLRGISKLERDLRSRLAEIDAKLQDVQAVVRRVESSASGPSGPSVRLEPGIVPAKVSTAAVQTKHHGGCNMSPKSWASPFQDSTEILQDLAGKGVVRPPPRFGAVAVRRVNQPVQEALWNFFEDPMSSQAARWYGRLYAPFVLTSVTCNLMESSYKAPAFMPHVVVVQLVLDIIFLLDIMLRYKMSWSTWRFLRNQYNVIDIVSLISLVFNILVLSSEASEGVLLVKLCILPLVKLMRLFRRCDQLRLVILAVSEIREVLYAWFVIAAIGIFSLSVATYLAQPAVVETLPQALNLMYLTMSAVGSSTSTSNSTVATIASTLAAAGSVLYMAIPVGFVGHRLALRWQDRDYLVLRWRTRRHLYEWGFQELDLEKIIRDFDSAGSGQMTMEGFGRMIQELHLQIPARRALALFRDMDVNQSGVIEVDQILRVVRPGWKYDGDWLVEWPRPLTTAPILV